MPLPKMLAHAVSHSRITDDAALGCTLPDRDHMLRSARGRETTAKKGTRKGGAYLDSLLKKF